MSGDCEHIIFTVGHSTRTLPEFIGLLITYKISLIIDIRGNPYSRLNPHFNKETLHDSLKEKNIRYIHMPSLNGLRRPQVNSINLALKNKSFRGFADYMQTKEFNEDLLKIIVLSKEVSAAVMCSEAIPWRCHRSLISDALYARNIKIKHILNVQNYVSHEPTPSSQIESTKVTYPLFYKEKPQKTLTDFKS
ncbi:MAG: DUF488 domain-containing protein [Crenarchaeota archaeon]|nr:DUF488 domain-containing protein [Thermoproteota archaeon]